MFGIEIRMGQRFVPRVVPVSEREVCCPALSHACSHISPRLKTIHAVKILVDSQDLGSEFRIAEECTCETTSTNCLSREQELRGSSPEHVGENESFDETSLQHPPKPGMGDVSLISIHGFPLDNCVPDGAPNTRNRCPKTRRSTHTT